MSIFSDELSFEVLFKCEVFLYGFIKRGLGSAIRKSQMLLVHTFMAREQQDSNSFPNTSPTKWKTLNVLGECIHGKLYCDA